jgi:hypothetical protein
VVPRLVSADVLISQIGTWRECGPAGSKLGTERQQCWVPISSWPEHLRQAARCRRALRRKYATRTRANPAAITQSESKTDLTMPVG